MKTAYCCYASVPSLFTRSQWLKFVIHVESDSNQKLIRQTIVNNEHGLPIYDMAPGEINPVKPTVTSINGSTNYYEITPDSTSLDIMEHLFAKRKEFSVIVRKHTNQYLQKMQLTAELSLKKPVAEETEMVTVYFNFETVSLYHTGLSDETYTELWILSFQN